MVGFITFLQLSVVAHLADGQVAGFSSQSLIPCRGKSCFFPPLSPLCCIVKNGCGPHTASCLLCLVGSDEVAAVRCNSLTMCGTLPAATCNWSLQWSASYFIMLCLHRMLALTVRVVGISFFWKKMYLKFINHFGLMLHILCIRPPLIQLFWNLNVEK